MAEIMKSNIPVRQSGMFKSNLYVYPDPKVGRPFRELVRLCFSDFFPMFDVPFRYGSGWDKKADAGPEPVVVLSEEMNDKLFGGREQRRQDRAHRGPGVPRRRRARRLAAERQVLRPDRRTASARPRTSTCPFNFLKPMKLRTSGNSDGWGPRAARPDSTGSCSRRRAGSRCGSSCPRRPRPPPTRIS